MQNLGAVRGHVYLNSMYKVRGYRIFHSTHRSDDIRKASKMSCPAGSTFNAMPYCPLWMSIPKRQATPWNARKNAYFIEVKFKWRKRVLSWTTRPVFKSWKGMVQSSNNLGYNIDCGKRQANRTPTPSFSASLFVPIRYWVLKRQLHGSSISAREMGIISVRDAFRSCGGKGSFFLKGRHPWLMTQINWHLWIMALQSLTKKLGPGSLPQIAWNILTIWVHFQPRPALD